MMESTTPIRLAIDLFFVFYGLTIKLLFSFAFIDTKLLFWNCQRTGHPRFHKFCLNIESNFAQI